MLPLPNSALFVVLPAGSIYAINTLCCWGIASGIILGSGDQLIPNGYATRGQAAAMLQVFMENIIKSQMKKMKTLKILIGSDVFIAKLL
jgi:hypothetical protein